MCTDIYINIWIVNGGLIACMLWQLLKVSATTQGACSIRCSSSYGNHLLHRTCCWIHNNEKSICGQGNNKALNYRQHTSNQLNVHFSSSNRAPPPQSLTSYKLHNIIFDKPALKTSQIIITNVKLHQLVPWLLALWCALITAFSRASSFGLEVPLFINSSKHSERRASQR